jgi:radical SAM protein with 4Fe4S-binding SPASM domain
VHNNYLPVEPKDEMHIHEKITLAPWVSWRIYHTESEIRCFISNERSRRYILLDAESATLFKYIARRISHHDLREKARRLGVIEEIDSFLADLSAAGLLSQPNGNNEALAYSHSEIEGCLDYNIENEMIDWCRENEFLYSCHLDITYNCNQKCIHCYNPNAKDRRESNNQITNELTYTEINLLLNKLIDIGVFKIIISGGEPTLRNDFLKIIQEARNKGFCVELFSNGINLNEATIAKLSQLGIHKISLSVYSHIPELHDNITGIKGSWDKTVLAFAFLKKHNIQTAFKCITMKSTISGYFETKQMGNALADQVIMDMSITAGYERNMKPLDLQPSEEQITSVLLQEMKQGELFKNNTKINPETPPCGAGIISLCIAPNGNIYPCTGFPLLMGNTRKDDLIKLWRKSFSGKNSLSKWKNIKIADLNECGKHEYCKYCPEICPGASWLATGSYLNPSESSCRQARAYQKAIELMKQHTQGGDIVEKRGEKT